MDLESLIEPLNLAELDANWVRDIWNGEFIENVDLPADYVAVLDNADICQALYDLVKVLKTWRAGDEDSATDKTWRNMVNIFEHKKLSALIFHLLQRGQKDPTSEESRTRSILAARTYISMLIVPGSNVYGVFHAQLFLCCLGCFKLCRMEEEEMGDARDIDLVNKQIKSLLNDLCVLVDSALLQPAEQVLEETVACLVDFTADARVFNYRLKIDRELIRKLKQQAHMCIDVLISEGENEGNEEVISLVFKFLLPKFTALGGSTKKAKEVWHDAGVSYCKVLLQKYGAAAVPGFSCLIQHLCYNPEGMERGENRGRRVKLVVELLASLPLQPYTDSLKWIVKLSRNAKPNLRLLALEVIGCLVMGAERSLEEDTTLMGEEAEEGREGAVAVPAQMQTVAHEDLVRVALERCEDVSGAVRTKAMTVLVFCTSPPQGAALDDTLKEVLESEGPLVELVRRRMRDERVTVRRTAMTLLHNLLDSNVQLLTKDNLEMLVSLCRDTSVLVRCGAVTCLSRLAQRYHTNCVMDAWLSGPMHQLSDPETKVQELVVENIKTLIVTSIDEHVEGMKRGPWALLSAVVRANMRRHLARACTMLAADSRILSNHLVEILLTHVGTEYNLCCWMLLSCVARHIAMPRVNFVLDYFNDSFSQPAGEDWRVLLLVLEVLGEWSAYLDADRASALRASLLAGLRSGRLPAPAVKHLVQLCVKLSKWDDLSRTHIPDWASDLLKEKEEEAGIGIEGEGGGRRLKNQAILEVADVALVAQRRPHPDTVDALIRIINSFDCPPTSGDSVEEINARVASAVVSLGKLSLRERATAVRVAPLCARLLAAPHATLPMRVNSMCVLTDLCTRFTSIVEPLLSGVCACLGSRSVAVRRTAVQLVTQLLVGDFLRLRGALFFHYLSLLRDPDERVRDVASYFVLRCLVRKNAAALYHNFVEAIFYYNGYADHPAYAKFNVSDEERELFTLRGEEKRASRLAIYDIMLSHMTDIQRLNTQMKLCREVEAVSNVEAGAGQDGQEVLRDCLVCVRKAARPPTSIAASSQDDDAAPRVALTNISKKMRLNVAETVVPIVLRVYRHWKTSEMALLPELITYSCDLFREYKIEVEEVFDADSETLLEIKHLQEDSSPAE